MEKYDKDGPFMDPIVRCAQCSKIVYREDVTKFGMCKHCGNKRVTNVRTMTGEEFEELKARNIDPDYLALFEVVEP